MVVFSHAFQLTLLNEYMDPLGIWTKANTSMGIFAVWVFFIISGYLIAQSWLQEPDYRLYLGKRFLRIFPALIVVVVLLVFVFGPIWTNLPLDKYFSNSGTWAYFSNILLFPQFMQVKQLPGVFLTHSILTVDAPLWTLPFEFSMYLVLMFVFLEVKRLKENYRKIFMIFGIFFALGVLCFYITHPILFGSGVDWFFQEFLTLGAFFFSGSLCYIFKNKIVYQKKIFLISTLLLLLTYIFLAKDFIFFRLGNIILLPYIILYIALKSPNFGTWITKHGDWSYGIYIIGWVVEQTLVGNTLFKHNPILLFIIAYPITLLLARFSWKYIEKPSLAKKNDLRNWIQKHRRPYAVMKVDLKKRTET